MEENKIEEKIIVEQKEPKKKGTGVLIVLLTLIILGLAGYIYYDKFYKKDSKNGSTNNQINPYIIGDLFDEYSLKDFEEIGLGDMIKIHEEASNLKINKMYVLSPNRCVANRYYFYITDNGVYSYYDEVFDDAEDPITKLHSTYNISNLKKQTDNKKITRLELVLKGTDYDCLMNYDILGVTDDLELYSVLNNKFYGKSTKNQLVYGRIIGSTNNIALISDYDKSIVVNGKETNYIYKLGFAVDGESYIITEDLYLYDLNNNKLYNKTKIKDIQQLESEGPMNKYKIVFENGNDFTFLIY